MGIIYGLDEPSKVSTGHLFWDDGNSIDTIENGNYILLKFEGTQVCILCFHFDTYLNYYEVTDDDYQKRGLRSI